ncbi:K(+)/H(+) antiporter, partial [Rhodotorula sphaerocarpa]
MAIRKHPLVLVLVRLCLTPLFSRLLEFAPDRARQPRLLSGILAGILLSEAASDQIPAFTANIFSLDSIPYLSLIANLGLVASLFLISTLIHFSLIRRDVCMTVAVSTAGLAAPFRLGCAISVGLRHKCVNPSVKVTTRMTFFGTPTDITASSDLSRVLSELRLFIDPVRLVVLASGVLSDVIGGCLPALSVALASAGSGVVVTGSWTGPGGPTLGYLCAVLGLVLISAFFLLDDCDLGDVWK